MEGEVHPPEGVWEDWLRKRPEEARAEIAAADAEGAKHAVLDYRVLRAAAEESLLELRPRTGRMHQLRVQAAARGHSIRGDELYGAKSTFGPPAELPRDRVIGLHARGLTFLHPISYEPMTVVAPLPEYWGALPRSASRRG